MSTDSTNDKHDARQRGVEAVYRGFLFQHLYAVGCLLLARMHPELKEVISEQDEDVEVVLTRERRYVQVKYRSTELQTSDVSAALDRFRTLRDDHLQGRKQTGYQFVIVCNREPSAALRGDSRVADLGVHLVSPSVPLPADWTMPPALNTIDEALEWCRQQAELVPHTRLEARTLVWKLATEVSLASAGRRPGGHVFETSALADLFELLFVRHQHLPKAPAPYRAFESTPHLEEPGRVTLVVGLSGAGKTGWFAERALHLSGAVVYFDVGDNSDATVAPALVREIAGALADSGASDPVRSALYAGASGLTSLRAIDGVLARSGTLLTVAIDNVHRISAHRVTEIVSALPAVQWVLLAQPSSSTPELRARLGCEEQSLAGLAIDAIAGVFRDSGLPVTFAQAQRLKAITGGLPLFVNDAAFLCARRFSGDCDSLCQALEDASTTESSGQDAVLRASIENGNPQARRAAAALALASVRLAESEAVTVLTEGICLDPSEASRCIRELTDRGLVQVFANRDVVVHDAFRTVVRGIRCLLPEETDRVRHVLGRLFRLSISPSAPDRFIAYCRIAPHIGETRVVIDMAGSIPEHLHEHGSADALRQILTDTLEDSALSDEDRFWAADTLTFWAIQRGDEAGRIHSDMVLLEQRLAAVSNDRRARQTVAIKRLLVAGKDEDLDRARKIYAQAMGDAADDPHGWLILRYTYGVALMLCDALEAADLVTSTVANGYLRLVGLRPEQLFATNALDIRRSLGDKADEIELIKHVADAIDLRARVVAARGGVVALLKMWAFKLYALAVAPSSAVNAGKDVVDELLSIGALGDAKGFMERTLIPGIAEFRLPEEIIPLRAQYAVVLAYDGQVERARNQLADLTVFASSSPLLAAELENQRRLIEAIASGEVRLTPRGRGGLDRSGLLLDVPRLQAGRNEPCPCGSAVKFKRCCGR